MNDKHLSTQFDAELAGISSRVLAMGGLVESQVAKALYALTQFSAEAAQQEAAQQAQCDAWWRSQLAEKEAARQEEARRREREQAQAAVGNIINFASRAANEVLGGGTGAGKAGKKLR
jgi:hypothetical protein